MSDKSVSPASSLYPYRSEELKVASSFLGRVVYAQVYRPLNYESGKRYPLLILNDGQNNDVLKVNETIERLVSERAIVPVIAVSIMAGDRLQEFGVIGIADYLERGSKAEAYAQFVVKELMPVLQHYPIDPLEENHVIAGFSLGGLSALSIAWSYPDVFKKVGVFSGSLWWRKRDAKSLLYSDDKDRIIHQEIRNGKYKEGMKFWFQAGTRDEDSDRNENGIIDSIDDTLDLIVELTKKGYRPFKDVQYLEVSEGRHDPATWAKALPEFLKWIFPLQ